MTTFRLTTRTAARPPRPAQAAAWASLLGACCVAAGCRGAGASVARTGESPAFADDPFVAAELAAADPFAGAADPSSADPFAADGDVGRVTLDGNDPGVVRTASLDVPAGASRTAAKPARVTRVNPLAPPPVRTAGWLPGDGTDGVRVAAASEPAPPAPGEPSAPVDWAAEVAAFAGDAGSGSDVVSDAKPQAEVVDDLFAEPAPAPAAEPTAAPFDPDALPSAPLWDAGPAPAAEPAEPEPPAEPAAGAWKPRKTAEIDPFAEG